MPYTQRSVIFNRDGSDALRCTDQRQRAVRCEHGRPAACFTRHRRDDVASDSPVPGLPGEK